MYGSGVTRGYKDGLQPETLADGNWLVKHIYIYIYGSGEPYTFCIYMVLANPKYVHSFTSSFWLQLTFFLHNYVCSVCLCGYVESFNVQTTHYSAYARPFCSPGVCRGCG